MSDSSHDDPNILRILVLGESKAGKTLLIRRLCYDVFDASSSLSESTSRLYWNSTWPPTIGFAVDVLVRDAHMKNFPRPPAFISADEKAPLSSSERFADRDRLHGGGGGWAEFSPGTRSRGVGMLPCGRGKGGRCPSGTPPIPSYVTQTIEFYELGGMHVFGAGAMLPLQGINFDGVIFVYDRANVRSSMGLNTWYAKVQEFLFPTQGKGPRVMLLGAHLKPVSAYLPMISSVQGRAPFAVDTLPDEILLDPSVRSQVWGRAVKTHPCSSSSSFSFLSAWVCAFFSRLWGLCTALRMGVSFLHIFFIPSLALSEMFQEERGDIPFFRLFVGKMEWCARWMLWLEHLLTFGMSFLLFGMAESSWQEPWYSSKAVLNRIQEDQHCIVRVHVCHLYDRIAFEPSVDEIISFFDTLHHEKIAHSH